MVLLIHLFSMATYSLKWKRLAQLLTLPSPYKALSGHVKAGMQEQEVRGHRDIPGCHFTYALPATPPHSCEQTPTLRKQSPSSDTVTESPPHSAAFCLEDTASLRSYRCRLAWAQTAGAGSWKGLLKHRELQFDKHQLAEGKIHLQILEVT